ncbi:hypothetical protein PENSPDRAFT_758751 [Peniophora sp. CONT]|nr:hypothetical protein PENSPDRAFT_758751 [Peniophora sp. CONT]
MATTSITVKSTSALAAQVRDLVSHRLREVDGYLDRAPPPGFECEAVEENLMEELNTLQSLSFQFARRLNVLRAPVLRLPSEVIRQILVLATHIEWDAYGYRNRYPVPWIRLGHVCSKMRNILLATCEVWASVVCAPCGRAEFTEEIYRRAAGSPLTLSLVDEARNKRDNRRGWRPPKYSFVLPGNSHHIIQSAAAHLKQARLILVVSPMALSHIASAFGGVHFPYLEHLELDNTRIEPEHGSMFGGRTEQSVLILPKGKNSPIRASRLSILRLCHAFIPFEAVNLTEFSLFLEEDNGAFASQLFDCLRSCTKLRSLNLHNRDYSRPLPWQTAPSRPELRPIALPSLRRLELTDTCDRLVWLWSAMSVSPKATVFITQQSAEQSTTLESRVNSIRAFSTHIWSPDSPPPSGVSLIPERHELGFRLYTARPGASLDRDQFSRGLRSDFSPFARDQHLSLCVKLTNGYFSTQDLCAGIAHVAEAFSLAGVEKMELTGDYPPGAMSAGDDGRQHSLGLATLLHPFRALHNLCVTGYTGALYSVLVRQSGQIICPELSTLVLIDARFDGDKIERFLALLEDRASAGSRLQELKLEFLPIGRIPFEASLSFQSRLKALVPSIETHGGDMP